MRKTLLTAPALAIALGLGLAACNEADENAAVPPADEPTATGSIPAEEPAPVDPAAPPPEGTAQ